MICRLRAGLVVVFVVVSGLAGCSRPTLDYRHADVVDGLIYAKDADTPFSGVVTHVPSQFMLGGKGYEKVLLEAGKHDTIAVWHLMRNHFLCRTSVRKGYVDGPVMCFVPGTDTRVIDVRFEGGSLDGDFTLYNPSHAGQVLFDGQFDEGLPDGTEKVYSSSNGRLYERIDWSDGVYDGDYVLYDEASGKVVVKGAFDGGQRDGTWKIYAAGGDRLRVKMHYRNGRLDGEKKVWDTSGKLVSDVIYADGHKVKNLGPGKRPTAPRESAAQRVAQALSGPVVATPARTSSDSRGRADHVSALDKCVQGWVAAHHAEAVKNGLDDAVSFAQTQEWRQWCKAGKQAPTD